MIKLAEPDIGFEELEEVRQVINSKYLVEGDKVYEFERIAKEFLGVKHAFAVSSGTAALHLALLSLNITFGDEILVPDFTFPATSNVVEIVGATSRFIDINLNDFCINTEKIEMNITKNTKAIIPVHEFGHSANMDKIQELAKKYNLFIIEDAACALGAKYNGKMIGTIGDIGCFSLHPRKAITTGEGGIIVTNNDGIAKKIRALKNHGIELYDGKASFVLPGLNYRMTNIQGAIGIVQMKKITKINSIRKEIALKYNHLLKNNNIITIPSEKENIEHVWQTYHIILRKEINRDKIMARLKQKDIETNIGAYAVHEQPYYLKKYSYCDKDFTNSIISNRSGLALPLHINLRENHINYIVKELEKSINE